MMIHKVYANGNEVSAKAGMNKALSNFPDVCLSPPSPPAGPIPIPYPDFSFSKDLKKGSKKVKVKGKPAALKDQSHYKSSPLGDEAATRSFGANILTHQITGKTYFQMWSMDVKYEGKNVCRHCDITSSNHASKISTTGLPPTTESGSSRRTGDSDKPKCDCCGKAAHTKMQSAGDELSEEQFYSPSKSNTEPWPDAGEAVPAFGAEARDFLKEVRSGPCKNLLPPSEPSEKTKCNKYFISSKDEKKRIEKQWDDYRDTYYKKFKVPRSTDVGHRVPKAAGGCPTGPGNLTPMPEPKDRCKKVEDRLSVLQRRAVEWHRRVRKIM